MKLFREGDLEFEFPDQAAPRRFDDPKTHRLAHCMKAIDCIFEWRGDTYFLEIKDPENPKSQTKAKDRFLRDFQSDVLNNKLTIKYRDSFIYEYASGGVKGRVHYVVVICMKNLDSHLLSNRSDGLRKSLPLEGPNGPWQRPFVSSCTVLNIDAWKRLFTQIPVRRVSEVVSGSTPNQA
jgi:hypothetical protein